MNSIDRMTFILCHRHIESLRMRVFVRHRFYYKTKNKSKRNQMKIPLNERTNERRQCRRHHHRTRNTFVTHFGARSDESQFFHAKNVEMKRRRKSKQFEPIAHVHRSISQSNDLTHNRFRVRKVSRPNKRNEKWPCVCVFEFGQTGIWRRTFYIK